MITLAEAKTHCRIDGNDSDAELAGFIAAAAGHVENYLGVVYATGEAPAPVKAACALLVADLHEHREAQVERPLTDNRTFVALLNPYREMGV